VEKESFFSIILLIGRSAGQVLVMHQRGALMNRLKLMIIALSIFITFGCTHSDKSRPNAQNKVATGRDLTVPVEAAIDGQARTVLFSLLLNESTYEEKLCLYDLATGKTKELLRGKISGVQSTPIKNLFTVMEQEKSQDIFVFFDNGGVKCGELKLHTADAYIGPQWKKDGACFVFATDNPGLKEDDFNPVGFKAYAAVSYPSLEMKWFPQKKSFFDLSLYDDNMYVSRGRRGNAETLQVDVYDLSGHKLFTKNDMYGIDLSANGRHYLPSCHQGWSPFEIYDSATNKILCSFRNDAMETKGYDQYGEWNPQDDDLLLIQHFNDADSEPSYMDVYKISQKKSILRLKEKIYGWTADGKGLLAFQNAQFKIIPINKK
jgi:hypothetical protein